ncbi:hypothetical protein E2C01_028075 [Portunus trituberculatus]|uniref:Uncharacterized protein n=1 Tax=Portunus trituberculatus TaxID=210409 RepID=A0A5B7EMY0_PORTR|nr:hypothetical protein [Portunus trituberculatus]
MGVVLFSLGESKGWDNVAEEEEEEELQCTFLDLTGTCRLAGFHTLPHALMFLDVRLSNETYD